MIAVDCCVKSQGPRWQWYAMMPPFFTLTGGTLIFILYLYVVWVKTEAWWHTDLGHFDIFNFSTMQVFLVATFWPIAACTTKLVCRDCHTEPIKSVGSSTPSNHAPSLQCWNLHATWGEANVRLYTTTQCPQCLSNHSDSPGLIIRNWSVTLGHPERHAHRCILMELYTGELLFGTHENLEHLALMDRGCCWWICWYPRHMGLCFRSSQQDLCDLKSLQLNELNRLLI